MNLPLITTIILTLASIFNLGLASGNNTGTTQTLFDKLELQAQTDEESVTVTQTLGPDGGSIVVDFMGHPREVIFAPGALLAEIPIKVTVTKIPNTFYFDRGELIKFYPIDDLEYVSPQVIIEFPLSALNWQEGLGGDPARALFGVSPGYFDPDFEDERYVRAEIRATPANGGDDFFSSNYRKGTFAAIRAINLKYLFYANGAPEVLKTSVQIVDEKLHYEDSTK